MTKGKTEDSDWDAKTGRDFKDDAPAEAYAGGGSHVVDEAKGGITHKARGGSVHDREAEGGHEANEERDRRRRRRRGGRTERLDGDAAKRRLDRTAKKRGGGVGADTSPLTTASRTTDRKGGSGEALITGGGD